MRGLILLIAMGAPATLVWEELPPMPRAQGGAASALAGEQLIAAGGATWDGDQKLWLRDVQIFDLRARQWRMGPALPEPLAYGPALAVAGGMEIYGGSTGARSSRAILRLDAAAAAWTAVGTTPQDTVLGRAARVGEDVFLFGGCADAADLTTCTAQVSRRRDGRWEKVSAFPAGAVALGASAVAGGKIYWFGGCSMPAGGVLANRAEAWEFDPRTFAWKRLRDLPKANRGLAAAAADDRLIYLFAGYHASVDEARGKGPEFGFSRDVWIYDVAAHQYRPASPSPLAVAGSDFFLHGDTFYAAGGEHRMRGRTARAVSARMHRTGK